MEHDPALALHITRMESGSAMLRNAIRAARGETSHSRSKRTFAGEGDLVWSYHFSGPGPLVKHGRYSERAAREMEAHVAVTTARRQFVDSLRVSRDPCPRCGVRGDVGCKHRQVAA
jgi:hypothetical protein